MKKHWIIALSGVIVIGAVLYFGNAESARKTTPISSIAIKVTAPNGGETFVQGGSNKISWLGGQHVIGIALASPQATIEYEPGVLGWINTHEGNVGYVPNGSANWDAKQVCRLVYNLLDPDTECKPVLPGTYKILVLSENPDGSTYIASGHGANGKYTNQDYRGNWDVSDQVFTILSQ